MAPKTARRNSTTATLAPVNARFAKRRGSRRGCGWRSSQRTNAMSPTTPMTVPVTALAPQPCGASMSVKTSAAIHTTDSSPPA
jgi:hypothetical protein